MIKDLQMFGKWLNENNLVDFGKNVDNDYILVLHHINGNFLFKSFNTKENSNLNYFNESCFSEEPLISTDQSFMIPSNTNVLGFSPFFVKLGNYKNAIKVNDFTKKVNNSLKLNKEDKEFVKFLNDVFDNFDEFVKNDNLNIKQKNNLILLHNCMDKYQIKELIINYYAFILDNYENLVNEIKDFNNENNIDFNKNIYLACIFEDYKDLINDFFYIYSDFFKLRKEKVSNYEEGICSICGEKGITYPNFPYFLLDQKFVFNYTKSNKNQVKNSKLKLCSNCNRLIKYSNDKLFSRIISIPNIAIIPKIKNGKYDEFIKISNKEINNFEKINEFLKSLNDFNFDLIVYKWNDKKTGIIIKSYIENYKAFLVQFNNLYLYNKGKMNYLMDELLFDYDKVKIKNKIISTFDFEFIFKDFFCNGSKNKVVWPSFKYFYEIFVRDLTGKNGIFEGDYNSKTLALFSNYSENIYSFIYEVNINAINRNMINEIVYNCVIYLQKNLKDKKFEILKRLNYYFLFKKEIFGDKMLSKDDISLLKEICGKYDKKNRVIFDELDAEKIIDCCESDNSLIYFLLGQFISLIDDTKYLNNKNKNVFSSFISNINKNNIKELFVTEVLQKNNFYIEKMNKKGKFIFNLLESNIENLFNDEKFSYEDYVLLLFTGYYTTCILSSSYHMEEKQ